MMKIAACILTACLLSSAAIAKTINLYDQPQPTAKVVGTVDLSAGIIPIFTPKDGSWMKIGDPRNGNVGWVKTNELDAGTGSSVVTFTQKTIQHGNTPAPSQTIPSGQPEKLTDEQMRAIQQIQLQQKAVQESVQKSIQTLMQEMNTLIKQLPMVFPMVIMPADSQKTPAKSTPAQQTKPTPPPNKQ